MKGFSKFVVRLLGMWLIVCVGIPGLAVLPFGLAVIGFGWWTIVIAEKL